MKDLTYYEELFRGLHTNMQRGKPAPHKAFLLLSIIDLIEEGNDIDNKLAIVPKLSSIGLTLEEIAIVEGTNNA